MGYVQSGNTVTLRARLTQKGREELLSGTTQLTVKYFALGDGDANYRTSLLLSPGYVPDVTGDYSGCTLSLASGVGIHHPIDVTGNTVPSVVIPPPTTATTSTLLFGCGSPSNITLSGNTFTCDVYINRLLNAENKYLYDWYSNAYYADNVAFNLPIGNSRVDNIPGNSKNHIQFSGTNNGTAVILSGEPYANFYDFIYVKHRHEQSNGIVSYTHEYDDVKMFMGSVDRYIWEMINNIFTYKNTLTYPYDLNSSYGVGYTNIIRTDSEKCIEVNNTKGKPIMGPIVGELPEEQLEVSPLITSFSSLPVFKIPTIDNSISPGTYSSTNLVGAGPGGLLVSAREYGYYAEFSNNDLMRGFLPTTLVENNYINHFSDNANYVNLYPAIRIKPSLPNKGTGSAAFTAANRGGEGQTPTLNKLEHVFLYDAFSGYYNNNAGLVPKYSFFYDGSLGDSRREFGYNEDIVFTMDKLKYDPFNPKLQNPTGIRGFSNNTYTPSEYELTQMSAFDHIITQGRLLRLTTDPYVDMDYGGSSMLKNISYGCVGNGGLTPSGHFMGAMLQGNYTKGDPMDPGVPYSKEFIFDAGTTYGTAGGDTYMNRLTTTRNQSWHASLQHRSMYGYGLTLLNYERYLADNFFRIIHQSLTASGEPKIAGIFDQNIKQIGDEYSFNIKIEVATKNIKNPQNGSPYKGILNLNFKHKIIRHDTGTRVTPANAKGWGYIDNISPIIVRTAQ